jgi:iron-sulfur cluster repair protein YtfE (RIC family)
MTDLNETMAKAAGAIRKVGAALRGEPGIFQRLKEEHGELTSLMNRVASTDSGEKGVALRRQLFPKIKRALLAHALAEEEEFYAVLRQYDEIQAIVSHGSEEHAAAEQLLERLEEMDEEPDSWLDVFEQVRLRMEHHIEQEEEKVFPLAQHRIDKAAAEAIEKRYLEAKERFHSSL